MFFRQLLNDQTACASYLFGGKTAGEFAASVGEIGLVAGIYPAVWGEDSFGVSSSVAVLSFIVAFGLAKSFTNLGAGALVSQTPSARSPGLPSWGSTASGVTWATSQAG